MDVESMNVQENATFSCIYKMMIGRPVALLQIDVINMREDYNAVKVCELESI